MIFNPFAACISSPLLFILWTHHNLFIHSSVNKHLGCFRVLMITNKAATNISQCFHWSWESPVGVESLGPSGNACLTCRRSALQSGSAIWLSFSKGHGVRPLCGVPSASNHPSLRRQPFRKLMSDEETQKQSEGTCQPSLNKQVAVLGCAPRSDPKATVHAIRNEHQGGCMLSCEDVWLTAPLVTH